MSIKYNKLVRDKIPEIIKQEGYTPVTKTLSSVEYKKELEKKLYEEYAETVEACGKERCGELADMLEVISALAALEGESLERIAERAEKKKLSRGGFDERIYLIEKY